MDKEAFKDVNSFLKYVAFSKKFAKAFWGALLVSAMSSFFDFLPSVILLKLLDVVFKGNDLSLLNYVIAVFLLVFFLSSLFMFFRNFLSYYLSQKIIFNIRNMLFEKFLRVKYSDFQEFEIGDFYARIGLDQENIPFIINSLIMVINRVVFIIFSFGFLIYLNYKLLLVSLIIVPPITLITGLIQKKMKKYFEESRNLLSNLMHYLNIVVSGFEILKTYNLQDKASEIFNKKNRFYYKEVLRLGRITSLLSPIVHFLTAIAISIVIYYGGRLVIVDKTLTVAKLLTFLTALGRILNPLKRLTMEYNNIYSKQALITRIRQILDLPQEEFSGKVINNIDEIILDNLSFKIGEKTIFENLSFKFSKNKIYFILGESGRGKTTLFRLLLKLYDFNSAKDNKYVCAGNILVNDGTENLPITKIDTKSLRNNFAYVGQKLVIFDLELETYFFTERARELAKKLNIDKELNLLLDGKLNVDKLSGGQLQRFNLLRAFLSDKKWILLDEPTSALDDATQDKLAEILLEEKDMGKTLIVITHRKNILKIADEVLELK